MKRDLGRLAADTFDVLVIGGGITGASIAWDAALRGLSVALVERRDFGGATSAATSKLIHGGLRYLKNMEFALVRESLRERRIMERVAPHLVHPLPFVAPTYGSDAKKLGLGLALYDKLGFDKGRLSDPAKRIPNHRRLVNAEILEMFPSLPKEGLNGGFLFHDCQMASPERLTLAFVQSAAAKGAAVANWLEVDGFSEKDGTLAAANVRDDIGGERFEIRARCFVNASGCWADRVLGLLPNRKEGARIVRSKGIHLLLTQAHPTHALAMMTKSGRHVFLLPWRGLSIAGTTDTPYEGDPDELSVTEKDIADFLAELNGCIPDLNLEPVDVIASYCGLRPLADDSGAASNSYDASRKHEIADHATEGGPANLLSALGGKYTTSRSLAQQAVDKVFEKIGKRAPKCRTALTPLVNSPDKPIAEYRQEARAEAPGLPPELVDHLIIHHGTDWKKVAALAESDPKLKEPVWPHHAIEPAAQIAWAAENEMAIRLEDAVCRRTDLRFLRRPDRRALETCAALMGERLGWSDEDRKAEIERLEKLLG